MDIAGPELGFAGLAEAMGVPARRVGDADAFCTALREAMSQRGPHLIEAAV
jgi:acetolactate synthase-1/2/3 large subunit